MRLATIKRSKAMTDEQKFEDDMETAQQLVRAKMGGTFKNVETEWRALQREAFPDQKTFFVPVLVMAVLHKHDDEMSLVGTAFAGPEFIPADLIRGILEDGASKVDDRVMHKVTVLDDGTSVDSKDMQ